MAQQTTIKTSVNAVGVGLHSGQEVHITLRPADANTGIVFRRIDLSPPINIHVSPDKVQETLMCTKLVHGTVSVSTIEHLMAALCAERIDNIVIEINGAEVPVLDGSAAPFIFLLQSAGTLELNEKRHALRIKKPVRVDVEDKFAEFSPYEGYRLNVSIDFPHPVIAATKQEIEFEFSPATFEKEVSRARTFGFAKDIEKLHQSKLGLGASLENAVGVTDTGIMNPEGLRYRDEFVRHKLLDTIGDLYVAGPIIGAFRSHKSGHALNNQLLLALLKDKTAYEWVEV